ncbi:LOB domain-containing protein 4 isoform X3 [Eucalyptus grandis]|uniref:LOB domain-containing protein 4 isoform X3 n=1 Tax=Eucalyptus grandis TaxID=71139 RepID=UPI00192E9851|nr:LOB domain-containing protein 4 isoform X3 [Eucalyptus grandis]
MEERFSIRQELPEHQRSDAVSSMVYEANARMRDPVYGCVGAISSLQQQVDVLQNQLALAQAEVVHMRLQTPQFPSTSSSAIAATNNDSSHSRRSYYPLNGVEQADVEDSLWS